LRNLSLLSKFLQQMHSLRHRGLSRSNERCDAIRDGFFVLKELVRTLPKGVA